MDKRMWKKILAMLLLMSCICTTLASAESLKRETVQPEAERAISEDAEVEKLTPEDGEAGKIASEDAETEKAISEESEEAFHEEQEISAVLVTVKADPGVFPKGAKLQVKKVGKAAERKVDSALKEKLLENQENLLESMIFDISVLNKDGEEVQPDTTKGEVKVQFYQYQCI